jgi:hypothetical protein
VCVCVCTCSILGPVLFSVFLASLTALCANSKYIKYADDLTILHFMRCSEDDRLSLEYGHIVKWCSQHAMMINTKKSHILDICTKTSIVVAPVDSLEIVTSTRLLGLILNKDLKWNDHVMIVKSRVSKLLFSVVLLKRASVNEKTLWSIYYALIRSVLVFAYPAICNMSAYLFKQLLAVESKVARVIGSDPPKGLRLFCEQLCINLAARVNSDPRHPLRQLCELKPQHAVMRLRSAGQNIRALRSRTTRFQNCFMRFI